MGGSQESEQAGEVRGGGLQTDREPAAKPAKAKKATHATKALTVKKVQPEAVAASE